MELELNINGVIKSLEVSPQESLLAVLRREGYYSVKHGCESGECGACTVLVDGVARPGCVTLAVQAGGCTVTTAESLAHHAPNEARKLHPLQEAFIETGAIQCGFCTPGMLLSASALLKRNSSPSEAEVREALSGNLCRCTGYVKPVQAVLRAAAMLRGEKVAPLSQPVMSESTPLHQSGEYASGMQASGVSAQRTATLLKTSLASPQRTVGRSERRIDSIKLVTGKPAFVDDIELRGMLSARILTSPHAHALIREINVSEARALPGVYAVLTYKDVQRIPYAAEPSGLESGLCDRCALDNRVRYIGDRVAAVAAETPEIAEQALKLIQVDYEVLPAVLDPRLAISAQAPCIHPEPEASHIYDAAHNLAAYVSADAGDVVAGFAQADLVVEGEYIVPQVQQTPLENHIAITYWDEDERLVVRTSTQAPSHIRQRLAPVIGLPPRRIRVIKPNVGGSFGAKQDLLIEDLCALLTIATNRPVRLEYSRAEEFCSSSRHPHIIHMKTGVKRSGEIVANSMQLLANTGAYGSHALSAQRDTGFQTLPLYACPNLSFEANVVYTNLPPAGAFTGSGVPQGFFALESQMDEIAHQLGMDALELRRKNWIKTGDKIPLVGTLSRGRGDAGQIIERSGLEECLRLVEEKLQWQERHNKDNEVRFRRGVGLALAMHRSASAGRDMAGASLKLNEDGSFDLLTSTGDGGGATIVAQVVADVLGVPIEDIIVHPSDSNLTPFASSPDTSATLSTSVGAARQAAEQVRAQILAVASQMLKADPGQLTVQARNISTPAGQSVTTAQVALHTLYGEQQRQIMMTASWTSEQVTPSFAAQGVEVEVDTETGVVRVLKVISAIDVGRAINPQIVEGQIEGGVAQALGYSLSEEMLYDQRGVLLTASLSDYRIFGAADMPALETYMVESEDLTHPLGARTSAEIPLDGIAPAIANAVADAIGMRLRQIPLTPERVLRALRARAQNGQ